MTENQLVELLSNLAHRLDDLESAIKSESVTQGCLPGFATRPTSEKANGNGTVAKVSARPPKTAKSAPALFNGRRIIPHHHAGLSYEAVHIVRTMPRTVPNTYLAAAFGVGPDAIGRARRGKTWRDHPTPAQRPLTSAEAGRLGGRNT